METKLENTEKVENLTLGNLVDRMPKKTGGKAFLIPKLFILRIRNKWRKMKTRLEEFIGGELVNNSIEKKENNIDKKIEAWEEYSNKVREELRNAVAENEEINSEFSQENEEIPKESSKKNNNISQNKVNINNISAALTYSKDKIEKLRQKEIRINKKGLGIFTLSALAIKKLISNGFNKIKSSKESKKVTKEKNASEEKNKKLMNKKTSNDISELLKKILEEYRRSNELEQQKLEETKRSNELKEQILSMLVSLQYTQESERENNYTK